MLDVVWSVVVMIGILLLAVSVVVYYILRWDHYFPNEISVTDTASDSVHSSSSTDSTQRELLDSEVERVEIGAAAYAH